MDEGVDPIGRRFQAFDQIGNPDRLSSRFGDGAFHLKINLRRPHLHFAAHFRTAFAVQGSSQDFDFGGHRLVAYAKLVIRFFVLLQLLALTVR